MMREAVASSGAWVLVVGMVLGMLGCTPGENGNGRPQPDLSAGQAIYDDQCATCHILGTYDPKGTSTDLSGTSGLLVNDLSTIDVGMPALTLTDEEIFDLGGWLDAN